MRTHKNSSTVKHMINRWTREWNS